MTYGYIRVSTDLQTTENQRTEILSYCKNKGMIIDTWVNETVSGTVNPAKRELGKLLNKVTDGDFLIITELSRLGRSLMMILKTLEQLQNTGVTVIAIKNNFTFTTDPNDITSKVISFAFGLSAEIERNLISERTKMGLQRARQQGKIIGHYKGYKCTNVKLSKYSSDILYMLDSGSSILSIAKKYNVNWITARNFIRDRLGYDFTKIKSCVEYHEKLCK